MDDAIAAVGPVRPENARPEEMPGTARPCWHAEVLLVTGRAEETLQDTFWRFGAVRGPLGC